ncbi:MAG: GGDEF domain-containing protein [Desulfobacterales bacterium]|jgi:diguanylate cyclase (GGDEF)-like protein
MNETDFTNLNKTVLMDDDSDVSAGYSHPYLVIYIGNASGRRHKLVRGTMTIGRSNQADITIDDERISRFHCIIEWLGETIIIQDNGSTNGTYVGSRKVNRAPLSPGVALQMGHSIMKIEYKNEAEIKSDDNLLLRASVDALTGVFNRQHFIQLASMEIAYAIRYRLPIGIIMMDIDHFKRVNDKYGHQTGDIVLAQFANVVLENKRTEDLFARYGGEEFISMPRGKISRDIMYMQCERLRRAIENFEFHFDSITIRITVSFGFHFKRVECSEVETTLNKLIREADQALYLAKARGRNRTESLL